MYPMIGFESSEGSPPCGSGGGRVKALLRSEGLIDELYTHTLSLPDELL
jgi:hypothetical protein